MARIPTAPPLLIRTIGAARAVIAGRALATAKTSSGNSEALRVLVGAQRSAKQARISAMVQLRHLMFTAPDELRDRYAKLSRKELTKQCARMRPRLDGDSVRYATKTAALSLARRVQTLEREIDEPGSASAQQRLSPPPVAP